VRGRGALRWTQALKAYAKAKVRGRGPSDGRKRSRRMPKQGCVGEARRQIQFLLLDGKMG